MESGLTRERLAIMKPKCLMLISDGFEDMEFLFCAERFREAGFHVVAASPMGLRCPGIHGYHIDPDMPILEINPFDYDWVVIPGGACSERLRLREEVLDIARTFMEDGRKVVSLGRGAQVLISAGALDGRRITCPQGIRDDVRAAGGIWRDEPAIMDGNLYSCRSWQDLHIFFQKLFALIPVTR